MKKTLLSKFSSCAWLLSIFLRASEICSFRCRFAFHQQKEVLWIFFLLCVGFSTHYTDDSWACFCVSFRLLLLPYWDFLVCSLSIFSSSSGALAKRRFLHRRLFGRFPCFNLTKICSISCKDERRTRNGRRLMNHEKGKSSLRSERKFNLKDFL